MCPVEWGESRNIKLVRASLIAFPSAFVLLRVFSALDTMDRAHGGAGVSGLWIWAALGFLVGATWILPVPRPEVLNLPRSGGSAGGWRWRLVRAVFVAGVFLVVFGVFWEVANLVTLTDAGMVALDAWVPLSVFAFLYATASLLFVVDPGEALVGDLRPWGGAEVRAARLLLLSLVASWLLVGASLLGVLILGGANLLELDLAPLAPIVLLGGGILGLTVHVLANLARKGPPSVALADKET